MKIRQATAKDLDFMCSLLEQLGYKQDIDLLKERFDKFLSLEGYGVVLAEEGAQVVGMLAWSKSMLLISDTIRIRIEALVVDQGSRWQGVGKFLLAYLEEHVKKFSPVIIELTSRKTRATDGTHDFYDVLGYANVGENQKVYLRKEL